MATHCQRPKATCDPAQTEPIHRGCRRSVDPQINLDRSLSGKSLCWANSSLKERNEEKKNKSGSSVRTACVGLLNESSYLFPSASLLNKSGGQFVRSTFLKER